MSDPYRSNYYGNTYAPQDQYGEAPYPGNGYSQPSYQHQLQLSQSRYSPQPLSPHALAPPIPAVSYPIDDRDTRSRSAHSHRRRDHSSRSQSRARDTSRSRASDHHRDSSRAKGIGATLVGAAGGGLLGHEIGGGALGTLGGALAGAIGANALEKRHERALPRAATDGIATTPPVACAAPSADFWTRIGATRGAAVAQQASGGEGRVAGLA
ncbi:hypothetical protein MMC29_007888 [Sticta canariensis]|nr:hypothetical protein [Sticta canariensis]